MFASALLPRNPDLQEKPLSFSQRLQEVRTGFERPFWVANVTELFERLSYYAAFAVIVRYLHENLKFSTTEAGTLQGSSAHGCGCWRSLAAQLQIVWAFGERCLSPT